MKYDYSQALVNIDKMYHEVNTLIADLEYDSITIDEFEKTDKFILERIINRLKYSAEYLHSAKAIANRD